MAKKRRKDKEKEEEEYEFIPPDFKEEEFLEKEIKDTKTTMLTIVFAGLMGAVAALITVQDRNLSFVGLLIVLGGMFLLPTFYRLMKVDTSSFQRKNWLGHIGVFFFTFLAIWVLLLNVPFADLANPTVKDVSVWIESNGTITELEYKYVAVRGGSFWVYANTTTVVENAIKVNATDTINITANIADNGKLVSADIAIGGPTAPYAPMELERDHRYGFKVSGSDVTTANLMFYIKAVDEAGNQLVFNPERPIPVSP